MSKWEHIAETTEVLSKGFNEIWDRKLRKDASVIVGDKWSQFILDSSNDLKEAQNHVEVGIDAKTNTLACIMKLPDTHPDSRDTGQPFSTFIMNRINIRGNQILDEVKNPYARELLTNQINSYKTQHAGQIAGYEASLVMDKRHNMAIENIEKLAKATYNNPQIYSQNRENALIAINSLDIDPIHKGKLARKAREEIAEAAASSVLASNPASILNHDVNYEWKKDLDFRSLARIENQARATVTYNINKNIREFNKLSEIHFKNILTRGKGIEGIEDKLSSLPTEAVLEFAAKEQMHINAYAVLERVKYAPLSAGKSELAKLTPNPEDENYEVQLKLYGLVATKINEQKNLAKADPALFVEKLFVDEIDEALPLPEKINKRLNLQTQKAIPVYLQKMLTEEEREGFASMLDSRDANIIRANLNSILSIESEYESLGHGIVEEILRDNKKLPVLTHFYIDANLYNRGNLKNDLARAMASNQAIGEMSNKDQEEIKKRIDEHISLWRESILAGQADNAPEVLMMQAGLLELARFYQFDKHMSIKEATDTAINNLFEASYIAPYRDWNHGKFYVPRTIIKDKEIIELDEEKINYGLTKLRSDLIKDRIEYDKYTTFSKDHEPFPEELEKSLRGGTFRLSKDKKSVYYVYFGNKGEQPLMKSTEEILTWDLLDFNEILVPNSLLYLHPYGAI